MVIQANEDYLLHFISRDFQYLTQQKTFQYKGVNLKSSYLISIIHELLIKYYFSVNIETKFNLSSLILRKKYGEHYNYYIEYLCERGFMSLVSKYYVGKKTNSYKLDTKCVYDVIRYKNTDKFLIKKQNNRYETSITEMNNSLILPEIRVKLIESLNKIKIDYNGAVKFLDELNKKVAKLTQIIESK